MGAWGFNVLENDASAGAYADYVNHMDAGLSPAEAIEQIRADHREALEDPDDAAYVWLGAAKAQWEYGHAGPDTIARVDAVARSDAHLAEWDDDGPEGREKRRKLLEAFAGKLRSPNPRPKRPRKPKRRTPVYAPGTCLAIARADGRFLAGLVTLNPIENPTPGQDTWGINSIALLDYLEPQPPTIDVFERRAFARAQPHLAVNAWLPIFRTEYASWHKEAKGTFTVVGTVGLTRGDALVPTSGVAWDFPDAEKLIERWRQHQGRPDLQLADRLEDVPAWRAIVAKVEKILRQGDPARPPRKTIEQLIDLSPLRA